MKVLVAYASRHTSTAGIAERVAARLREHGCDVDLRAASEVDAVRAYDGVVVGSAVYYGRWLKDAAELVRRTRSGLARRPVWLFSSGPVGDQAAEEPAEIADYRKAVGPRDHRVFSGALHSDRLGMAERVVARLLQAPSGDFRPWDEIDAWADGIAGALAQSRSEVTVR